MGHNDPLKAPLTHKLQEIYGDVAIAHLTGINTEVANLARAIQKSDRVIIWNGVEMGCGFVKQQCGKFNKPFAIIERGLFPQREDNYILDRSGVGAHSWIMHDLLFNRVFPEKTLEAEEAISNLKEERNFEYRGGTKLVVVGQLWHDSTVYSATNGESYDKMIDSFLEKNKAFKAEDVVFCPHPKEPNPKSKYKISTRSTLEECKEAALVVGISSTIFYELMAYGVPIASLDVNPTYLVPLFLPTSDSWKIPKEVVIQQILNHQFDLSMSNEQIKEKIERVLV